MMIDNYAEELTTPLAWTENSIELLAKWEESEVLKPVGLTLETYGTTRMYFGKPKASRVCSMESLQVPDFKFCVECLPTELEYLARNNSVSLVNCGELDADDLGAVLRMACDIIAKASPELSCSVRRLLRSMHVLNSPRRDFDVSFSVPDLPNSIFVSIPQESDPDAALRLAEAIVHEVMHLQLSLIERICPITRTTAMKEYAYAPWRNEMRPLSGLLHGLFVFRTLELFWNLLSVSRQDRHRDFASDRVDEIGRQIRKVELHENESLTSFGLDLFGRLTRG